LGLFKHENSGRPIQLHITWTRKSISTSIVRFLHSLPKPITITIIAPLIIRAAGRAIAAHILLSAHLQKSSLSKVNFSGRHRPTNLARASKIWRVRPRNATLSRKRGLAEKNSKEKNAARKLLI
jgi:hypothetical protein